MSDHFFPVSYDPRVGVQNTRRLSPALRAARREAAHDVRERMTNEFDRPGSTVRESWLAISTKFGVLEVVTRRLAQEVRELLDDLSQHPDRVQNVIAEPDAAYSAQDPCLVLRLVETMDAFITQHRSAYEMTGSFIRVFCASILQQQLPWIPQAALEEIARDAGQDTNWVVTLRDARNSFIHDRAPWIGIRLVQPGRDPEVLVLRSDMATPENPEDYLTLNQLQAIREGFSSALDAVANWLTQRIRTGVQRS